MADRRIIAIAVTPKAYDEIQKLKGDRTWTGYVIELALLENPQNQVLTDELANLPKKEKKGKAAVETEVPSAEEAERVEVEGVGTLIMPHTHKGKKPKVQEPAAKVTGEREPTNAELQAINKGEG